MNPTAPAVSVMVTLYNSAAYLNACLESLKRQTFSDFEVIMIDGGSQDETPAMAQRWASHDARFRYVPADGYERVSQSRARAVTLSRGEFIAVLDSDDTALPERLERQVAWMRRYPETALLATYYRVINAHGLTMRLSPIHFVYDIEMRWRLTFGNCLTHSTVMFRKDTALAAGNYDGRVRSGEDFEFYTRLMNHGRIAILREVLAVWRVHKQSLEQLEPVAYKTDALQTVSNAIERQLGRRVDMPVAEALYTQSTRTAQDASIFRAALTMTQEAAHSFFRQIKNPAQEQRILGRAIFLQLVDLGSKNCTQAWWPSVEHEWIQALRRLKQPPARYRWFLDRGLVWYYKKILKSDPRALSSLMSTFF